MPKQSVQKTYGNEIGGAEMVARKGHDPVMSPKVTINEGKQPRILWNILTNRPPTSKILVAT